jgi:hypothetical protein
MENAQKSVEQLIQGFHPAYRQVGAELEQASLLQHLEQRLAHLQSLESGYARYRYISREAIGHS